MDESSLFGTILRVLLEVSFHRLARWLIDSPWGKRVDEDSLVKKLKTTTLSAEAILDGALQSCITNSAVKGWLSELEDAVYDAEILLEEVSLKTSERKTKDINRTLEKLEFMLGQKDVLGLKQMEINTSCRTSTTSFLQESHVYGRRDDVEAITRLLLSHKDQSGDTADAIAIVGAAGIGKTTLVQLVYNDERIQEHFDLKIWICATNGLEAYSITKGILEAATLSTCDVRDLNVLQLRLREELSGKRLLLVLDDVANGKCMEWEIIKGPPRFGTRESKVIVATCDVNVAGMMRTLPVYNLNRLSFKDSWLLFARYAFQGSPLVAYRELKAVGRAIVKKCKGVPLAAKTLGSLLHFKTDHEE